MAWLSGWDKRIKLTIDKDKIDSALTWFPVTVFLTGSQAEEIFSELDADGDYMKVAFTKSDGETELYAECELFDHSESKGIYHVSRDGWAISDSADTDFYMYYDDDHANNDTYIGAITARTEVWDGNFELVCHMVDDNGNVDDSTSNSIDLTKASAGNPAEATGKVGQGQDFSSDYLTHPTFLDVMPDDLTFEAIIKLDTIDSDQFIIEKYNVESQDLIRLVILPDNTIRFHGEAQNAGAKLVHSTGTVTTATWYYVAGVHTHNAALKVYLDTAEDTGDTLGTILDGTFTDFEIGAYKTDPYYPFDGIIDEIRISDTPRTVAWLKATYNSLWDSLLTYGSEEVEEVKIFLISTATITTSTTGILSRGIIEALTSTSAITTSITATLSRGVTQALISTSAITTLITASLSRGIKEALNSTVNITTSTVSVLSRGIIQSLNSTVSITTSILARLKYDWWEEIKPTIDWIEETKTEISWTEEDKGEIDWDEESK